MLLRDEQVLDQLNRRKLGRIEGTGANRPTSSKSRLTWLECAREHAVQKIDDLRLPFQKTLMSALFWPESDNCEQ